MFEKKAFDEANKQRELEMLNQKIAQQNKENELPKIENEQSTDSGEKNTMEIEPVASNHKFSSQYN